MNNDPDLDQRAQDADEQFHYIVVEDAASMPPDGCLGIFILCVVAIVVARFVFLISVFLLSANAIKFFLWSRFFFGLIFWFRPRDGPPYSALFAFAQLLTPLALTFLLTCCMYRIHPESAKYGAFCGNRGQTILVNAG